MAKLVDHGIATLHAPQALGGFLVPILVLSPEALGAAKAALANRLQRTVNIALGSALATIGLTIPAVLAISHGDGHENITIFFSWIDSSRFYKVIFS